MSCYISYFLDLKCYYVDLSSSSLGPTRSRYLTNRYKEKERRDRERKGRGEERRGGEGKVKEKEGERKAKGRENGKKAENFPFPVSNFFANSNLL